LDEVFEAIDTRVERERHGTIQPHLVKERLMGNRDKRGREAKKPKKAKSKIAPAKSPYERTPPKPVTPGTQAAPAHS
jgi:hypothetical protein